MSPVVDGTSGEEPMKRAFDLLRLVMGYQPGALPEWIPSSEQWLTPHEFWQFMKSNGMDGPDGEGVELARRILVRANKMGEVAGDSHSDRFWSRPEKRWDPHR